LLIKTCVLIGVSISSHNLRLLS